MENTEQKREIKQVLFRPRKEKHGTFDKFRKIAKEKDISLNRALENAMEAYVNLYRTWQGRA